MYMLNWTNGTCKATRRASEMEATSEIYQLSSSKIYPATSRTHQQFSPWIGLSVGVVEA